MRTYSEKKTLTTSVRQTAPPPKPNTRRLSGANKDCVSSSGKPLNAINSNAARAMPRKSTSAHTSESQTKKIRIFDTTTRVGPCLSRPVVKSQDDTWDLDQSLNLSELKCLGNATSEITKIQSTQRASAPSTASHPNIPTRQPGLPESVGTLQKASSTSADAQGKKSGSRDEDDGFSSIITRLASKRSEPRKAKASPVKYIPLLNVEHDQKHTANTNKTHRDPDAKLTARQWSSTSRQSADSRPDGGHQNKDITSGQDRAKRGGSKHRRHMESGRLVADNGTTSGDIFLWFRAEPEPLADTAVEKKTLAEVAII
ncbi:hypothetical protein BGX28_007529 [Mortierella sp. GBA30]|nr:hypothetical protein BGX28_007529 [Mortierella sp. GBA30]